MLIENTKNIIPNTLTIFLLLIKSFTVATDNNIEIEREPCAFDYYENKLITAGKVIIIPPIKIWLYLFSIFNKSTIKQTDIVNNINELTPLNQGILMLGRMYSITTNPHLPNSKVAPFANKDETSS